MPHVIVLRPFVFTYPAKDKRQKLATELKITPDRDPITKDWAPTERELSDEIADHPWIREHHADGCIEHPEKTKARMDEVAEKRAAETKAAAKIIADAEAALARAGRGAAAVKPILEGDLERELDTPVNELQAARGSDIDKPINEGGNLNDDINKPVGELQGARGKDIDQPINVPSKGGKGRR